MLEIDNLSILLYLAPTCHPNTNYSKCVDVPVIVEVSEEDLIADARSVADSTVERRCIDHIEQGVFIIVASLFLAATLVV